MSENEELIHQLALLEAHLKSFIDTEFTVEGYCFKEQVAFINDPAPFKTAVCSRRSGKTIACAADLVRTALANPNRVCLYITLSRNNAKKIIWSELVNINRRFSLKGKLNETELSLTFQNGSVIYLSGAKDSSEIEKFRGLAITLCYLDECQSFRDYIRTLIDDVISKALFDYNGTLVLIGTPGPVPAGYFYECSTSQEWSHHSWTMFDNPWLQKKSGKTPQELLDRELKRKGITVDDPTIQRECFARWVVDPNSLVFKYQKERNAYDSIPPIDGAWSYIIGVDVGYDDADAIAVIGWHPKLKESYLVEEVVKSKQGISELAATLTQLIERYNPLKVVMDTGGLGKKIADEMRRRFTLPIHAAEKTRKVEYIEFLNDAMRTGKFYAKSNSRFAQDCYLVEWDKEADPAKPTISDRYHSDITDAVLYAFRESLHWLYEPETPVIPLGTKAWFHKQEEEMERAALQALHKKEDDILEELLSNM